MCHYECFLSTFKFSAVDILSGERCNNFNFHHLHKMVQKESIGSVVCYKCAIVLPCH